MKGAYYCGKQKMEVRCAEPVRPSDNEVRIEVAFCGICGTDLHIYEGRMDARVQPPRVIGHEMSGVIAETGDGVNGWELGDKVTVRPLAPCGKCPACLAGHSHICLNLKFLGIDTPGALQSSWTVPAYTLHRVPGDVRLDRAALVEPLAVACHDVRLGGVSSGEKVVVVGCGPIGVLIALVAQARGANVLGVEVNPARAQQARALDIAVVEPADADVKEAVDEWTSSSGADVVFEVSGSASGAALVTELARTRGRVVVVAIYTFSPEVSLFRVLWRELTVLGARVYEPQDFEKSLELVQSGNLPLDQIASRRCTLEGLGAAMAELSSGASFLKLLVDVKGDKA
jgi:(R,R)-butanediol dehydrogenase/meso-butanediol dehydrogenase/diacetyl reductase